MSDWLEDEEDDDVDEGVVGLIMFSGAVFVNRLYERAAAAAADDDAEAEPDEPEPGFIEFDDEDEDEDAEDVDDVE